MRNLLIVSIAALISFGFTIKSDSDIKIQTECPYLNNLHSDIEMKSFECPYLEGKTNQKNNSESEIKSCPYQQDKIDKSSKCPYLNEGNQIKSAEEIPVKIIKLKAS